MDLDGAIELLHKTKDADESGFLNFNPEKREILVWNEEFDRISNGFEVNTRSAFRGDKQRFFEYKGFIFFAYIEKERADNE